jgi:CO dehydrogenase/acetyl-CoA synthase beta subunit|tara:strand:- start:1102 stop:1371 length:270 start_codon:yes stop_codon:yes gene_type:complete
MTYVYETKMGGKTLVVEYVHSSVTDSIKVVDMTADGKFHRLNWMNDYGRNKLLAELEDDLTDRICGTGDYADIPGFEGTLESLNEIGVA